MKVPVTFIADFELAAQYYNLHALGEFEGAKRDAKNDLANAIISFAALAAEIRRGQHHPIL